MNRLIRLMATGLANNTVVAGTIVVADEIPARTLTSYFPIALTGPTTDRPKSSDVDIPALTAGSRYYDTTLSKLIFWDGATWRDIAGSAV